MRAFRSQEKLFVGCPSIVVVVDVHCTWLSLKSCLSGLKSVCDQVGGLVSFFLFFVVVVPLFFFFFN